MVTSSAEQLMVMAKVDAALQYETLRAHDRDNEESPESLGAQPASGMRVPTTPRRGVIRTWTGCSDRTL